MQTIHNSHLIDYSTMLDDNGDNNAITPTMVLNTTSPHPHAQPRQEWPEWMVYLGPLEEMYNGMYQGWMSQVAKSNFLSLVQSGCLQVGSTGST